MKGLQSITTARPESSQEACVPECLAALEEQPRPGVVQVKLGVCHVGLVDDMIDISEVDQFNIDPMAGQPLAVHELLEYPGAIQEHSRLGSSARRTLVDVGLSGIVHLSLNGFELIAYLVELVHFVVDIAMSFVHEYSYSRSSDLRVQHKSSIRYDEIGEANVSGGEQFSGASRGGFLGRVDRRADNISDCFALIQVGV